MTNGLNKKNMVKIFNIRLLTKSEVEEMDRIFNKIKIDIDNLKVISEKYDCLEQKFYTNMEFIARRLPLKRVRKKFKQIISN